jgi:hypothetical protein
VRALECCVSLCCSRGALITETALIALCALMITEPALNALCADARLMKKVEAATTSQAAVEYMPIPGQAAVTGRRPRSAHKTLC